MINEGARILEEGIAQRPGDIDVIWVYGYGFPIWRGGPMFYADNVGLAAICATGSRRLPASSDDKRHEPAALLAKLAAAGEGFGSLEHKSIGMNRAPLPVGKILSARHQLGHAD